MRKSRLGSSLIDLEFKDKSVGLQSPCSLPEYYAADSEVISKEFHQKTDAKLFKSPFLFNGKKHCNLTI